MKRSEKMSILNDLLKKGNNRFTVDDLIKDAGSERIARSAIWISRHESGMKLEAVRDGGRKVVAYINLTPSVQPQTVVNPVTTTPTKKEELVKPSSQKFQDVML